MKYRIIEDGNGHYRIQEQIQREWSNTGRNFESEYAAIEYIQSVIDERERVKRFHEIKRVVKEFDL